MNNYNPPDRQKWFGRTTSFDEYIYQKIQLLDLRKGISDSNENIFSVALLGYGSDLGTRLNQGRVGSSDGPDVFRSQFGRLAWHQIDLIQIFDCGDIVGSEPLNDLATDLAYSTNLLLEKGYWPLIIGGSHDLAYGQGLGLRQAISKDLRIGIVNIDAHFDLRIPKPNMHSGSPFYQILEEGLADEYLCLGLDPLVNPKSLYYRAKDWGCQYLEWNQIRTEHLLDTTVQSFCEKVDRILFSVDMDSIGSAWSPAVSAPAAIGLSPTDVINIFQKVFAFGKVATMHFAEFNPRFDIDYRTAKLIATLVAQAISQATSS